MVSIRNLTQLLGELHEVREDHGLSYGEKEDRVRSLLQLDTAFDNDVVRLLLSVLQEQSIAVDQFSDLVSHIEPYSRLFPDLWLSPALPALWRSPAVRQVSPATPRLLSMMRIGLKLVEHNRIPPPTVAGAVEVLAQWLAGQDLEVAEAARLVAEEVLLPLDFAGLLPLLFQACCEHLGDATVLLRFLSLAAGVSAQSEQAVQVCGELGFVRLIAQLCRRADDVLLQMNAVELLAQVATSEGGLEQLCRAGTTQWLVDCCCSNDDGSNDSSNGKDNEAISPLVADEALRVLTLVFAHASRHSFQFLEHLGSDAVERFLNSTHVRLQNGDLATKLNGERDSSSLQTQLCCRLLYVFLTTIILTLFCLQRWACCRTLHPFPALHCC
jgi:hypothetical protein